MLALLPETSLPHESLVSLNLHVLAFTVLISFSTGMLAGLAPALTLVRTSVHSMVQSGDRATSGGKSRLPMRTLLVVAEVGLTAMLLVGCAVGLKNLVALYNADLGYDPTDVAVLDLGWLHSSKDPAAARVAFYQRIETALKTVPGIDSVTETSERGATRGCRRIADLHWRCIQESFDRCGRHGRQRLLRDPEKFRSLAGRMLSAPPTCSKEPRSPL